MNVVITNHYVLDNLQCIAYPIPPMLPNIPTIKKPTIARKIAFLILSHVLLSFNSFFVLIAILFVADR